MNTESWIITLLGLFSVVTLLSCGKGDDGGKTPDPGTGTEKLFKGIMTCYIPAGTFMMGSAEGEPERIWDEPQHRVTLTQGFYMSKYEITYEQYDAYCEEMQLHKPDDDGFGRGNRPIAVSWSRAKAFAEWAGGSLPTEAQWEYACRGGNQNLPFGVGDGRGLYSDMANINGEYPYQLPGGQIYHYTGGPTHPNHRLDKAIAGGAYPPNSFGLHDMHGNLCEWCADKYDQNYGLTDEQLAGTVFDPTGPASGTVHVARGGDWEHYGHHCRAANRFSLSPVNIHGFRVVFIP